MPLPVHDLDELTELFCRLPSPIQTWSTDDCSVVSDFLNLHQMFASLLADDGITFREPCGICSVSFRLFLSTLEHQVRILVSSGIHLPVRCVHLLFVLDVVQVVADRHCGDDVLIRPEWKNEPDVFLIAEAGTRLSNEVDAIRQWANLRRSQFSRPRSNEAWAKIFMRSASGMRSLITKKLLPNDDARKASDRGDIQISRRLLIEHGLSVPEFDQVTK